MKILGCIYFVYFSFIISQLIGCQPDTVPQVKYDKTTIIVKSKEIQIISQADWHNNFRQQAVIIDVEGNEYRFNIGNDLTQYNKLLMNKKCIVFSYNGYIKRVEEADNVKID